LAALEGREAVLSQLLAHLDYLDETIASLSKPIADVIAPFAEELARLDTIHGVAHAPRKSSLPNWGWT
jgi:hypothetical protein